MVCQLYLKSTLSVGIYSLTHCWGFDIFFIMEAKSNKLMRKSVPSIMQNLAWFARRRIPIYYLFANFWQIPSAKSWPEKIFAIQCPFDCLKHYMCLSGLLKLGVYKKKKHLKLTNSPSSQVLIAAINIYLLICIYLPLFL